MGNVLNRLPKAVQPKAKTALQQIWLAETREAAHAAFDAFQRAGSEQVARSNLGYVCFLNGDYERAVAEYKRALLVGGEQRLLVLRNLLAARRAEKELDASAEN